MTKQIGAGIIGMGRIGNRHAEEIIRHPGLNLIGFFDINPKAKRPKTYAFPSISDFLNERDLVVVHVCTPNGTHFSIAKQCLSAGKSVVIEKPVTLLHSEAEELEILAKNQGLHIFCVMQNRYSPVSVWLKEVIDNQYLGKLFSVHVDCAWNRDDRYYSGDSWHGSLDLDGGPLYTQFSHFVDMLYWLFGDLTIQDARFFNHNHPNTEFEDSGSFQFETKAVKQGSFHYTTSVWDKNFKSSIQLIGEKGSIEISGQYMNEVRYCHIENYEMPTLSPAPPPNLYKGYEGSASNHVHVIHNVWETLNEKSQPNTPIHEGKMVTKAIENVYLRRK
ncbi:MAG: Gfo/Idh/MocA family oxidoreductase [Bacteroidia bacterium]|jgi:predicted dehydrogenase|nr:Gfo/Idh/MocA family oxidoreductase [Bacteroidia bacterium]